MRRPARVKGFLLVVPTLRPTADQREALERETTSPLSLIVEPVSVERPGAVKAASVLRDVVEP